MRLAVSLCLLTACATTASRPAPAPAPEAAPAAAPAAAPVPVAAAPPRQEELKAPLVRVDLPGAGDSLADKLRLQAAVAAFLFGRRIPIVPVAEANQVAERALRGERLVSGEACAMPAPAGPALDWRYPDARVAYVFVEHHPESQLVLEIRHIDGTVLLRGTAPVSSDAGIDELIAAVARTAPSAPGGGGGLGIVGSSSDRQGVSVMWVNARGDWAAKPPETSFFEPDGVALDACFDGGDRQHTWDNQTRLEIAADGRVAACVTRDPWAPAPPGHDCLCRAYAKLSFGAGAAGRAVVVGVEHHGAAIRARNRENVYAVVRGVSADDPTVLWSAPEVPGAALRACFARLNVVEAEIAVTWQLDAAAKVQAVELDWPANVPAKARACVEKALRAARFTCPQAGQPVRASGTLKIGTSTH